MATKKQVEEFIKEIAPYAQKAYQQIGKVKPSICIGMACVESAYGTSGIMRRHNAFFGQKVGTGKTATRYWSGKFFTSKTSEEYTVGTHTIIKAAFRAYDSMEQCVFNFYELLNSPLYKRVTADAHYSTQMKQIKTCGYMTSSTEVNSVLSLIETYNLTMYDNVDRKRSTIRINSRGEDVTHLQLLLTKLGYDPGKVDGIFGSKTENALKKYQSDNGLDPDGIAGPKAWKSLGE